MKIRTLFIAAFLLSYLFSISVEGQRLRIDKQLKRSPQDSMFVMTDTLMEQQYVDAVTLKAALGIGGASGTETLTVLSFNSTTGTLTYLDENAVVTSLDLTPLTDNFHNGVNFNSTTSILTFDKGDGTQTTVDLSALNQGTNYTQDNTGGNVPLFLVDPTTPATPIAGDQTIQIYDDGFVVSTYNGTTWTNVSVIGSSDAKNYTQDNTGGNIPLLLVDPTTPATPIAGDQTIQIYDDGFVVSTYNGTTWTNVTSLEGSGGNFRQDNTGGNIPLLLVDPTTPATPVETQQTFQVYDNGVVSSIYQGGTWINDIINREHTDGNILWVSTNGDNTTALKGNMHQPWADPWAAVNAAVAGDAVYILAGTYNSSANLLTDHDLFKADITIFSYPGVRLVNDDVAGGMWLVQSSAAAHNYFHFIGDAVVENFRIALNGQSGEDIYQMKTYIYDSASGNIGNGLSATQPIDNHRIVIDIDNFISINNQLQAIAVEAINESHISINIDNWISSHTGVHRGGIYIWEYSNSQLDVEIGCMSFSSTLAGKDLTSVGNGAQGVNFAEEDKLNSIFNIDIGSINSFSSNGFAGTTFHAAKATDNGFPTVNISDWLGAPLMSNNIINVVVGSVETYFAAVGINLEAGDTGNEIKVKVDNARATQLAAVRIEDLPAESLNNEIQIEGNFTAAAASAVEIIGFGALTEYVNLTGRYSTRNLTVPVIDADKNFSLRAAYLVGDPAQTPVSSANILRIPCMNTYATSLIVDPQVTELVSPITRDNGVR